MADFVSANTGPQVDSGITAANAALPKSGGTLTGEQLGGAGGTLTQGPLLANHIDDYGVRLLGQRCAILQSYQVSFTGPTGPRDSTQERLGRTNFGSVERGIRLSSIFTRNKTLAPIPARAPLPI